MSKPLPIEGEVSAPAAKNGNGKRKQLAVVENAPTSEIAWLQTIKELAPTIGIEGVRELMTMRREEQARLEERAFNAAMAEAQAEMEPVRADSYNPQTKSRFASYAALDRALRPIYSKHGFAPSFNTEASQQEAHVLIVCDVSHREGHSRRYVLDMPADGKGAKGGDVMTKTHATTSAVSYGMRYLSRMIWGMAVEDDDGNKAGKTSVDAKISAADVEKLRGLIMDTQSDIANFYLIFEIECLEDMPQSKLVTAVNLLEAKKNKKSKPQ